MKSVKYSPGLDSKRIFYQKLTLPINGTVLYQLIGQTVLSFGILLSPLMVRELLPATKHSSLNSGFEK